MVRKMLPLMLYFLIVAHKASCHTMSFIDLGPRSLRFTFSNFFSLETAEPIKAKFPVDPPLDKGMKVCSNGPGHIIKMAAMPIYGKTFKKLLLWN